MDNQPELALFWLLLNFLSIAVLAFFSMEEMACVSFNKIRLQFYVAEGSKRAVWLNDLLNNPSRLFGTTLIGVNVATFFGSECARQFHIAVGISPDLTPISQIFLVVILGELAPMFAARRYAEHVALMGIPLIYFTSKALAPAIAILGVISKGVNKLLGGNLSHPRHFLTQDELQKVLEEQTEETEQEGQDYTAITANIFRLRDKTAFHGMTTYNEKKSYPGSLSIGELKTAYELKDNYIIVEGDQPGKIAGIAFLRDLLHAPVESRLSTFCRTPWYCAQNTPILTILKQFRKNSENIAIVINKMGTVVGFIAFEDILEEIFAQAKGVKSRKQEMMIDRTFEGSTTLGEIKKETGIRLPGNPEETLSEFLLEAMEHHPEEGEIYDWKGYELIIKETTLLGIASVTIKNTP